MKVFGWDPVKLADAYDLEQLNELRLSVENDPKSHKPEHAAGTSIWLYTKPAKRKLDAIAWAVTYRLAEIKAARATGTNQTTES